MRGRHWLGAVYRSDGGRIDDGDRSGSIPSPSDGMPVCRRGYLKEKRGEKNKRGTWSPCDFLQLKIRSPNLHVRYANRRLSDIRQEARASESILSH